MNLATARAEIGTRLDSIAGLRVHPFQASKISPPAAIVALPDNITYDETYGRGSDSMRLMVHILVGMASARASELALAAYADGSGAKSVKAVLESGTYTAFHSLTVVSADFSVMTVAAVDYLAASFAVDLVGQGA